MGLRGWVLYDIPRFVWKLTLYLHPNGVKYYRVSSTYCHLYSSLWQAEHRRSRANHRQNVDAHAIDGAALAYLEMDSYLMDLHKPLDLADWR
jgi:hypothetical protein